MSSNTEAKLSQDDIHALLFWATKWNEGVIPDQMANIPAISDFKDWVRSNHPHTDFSDSSSIDNSLHCYLMKDVVIRQHMEALFSSIFLSQYSQSKQSNVGILRPLACVFYHMLYTARS